MPNLAGCDTGTQQNSEFDAHMQNVTQTASTMALQGVSLCCQIPRQHEMTAGSGEHSDGVRCNWQYCSCMLRVACKAVQQCLQCVGALLTAVDQICRLQKQV